MREIRKSSRFRQSSNANRYCSRMARHMGRVRSRAGVIARAVPEGRSIHGGGFSGGGRSEALCRAAYPDIVHPENSSGAQPLPEILLSHAARRGALRPVGIRAGDFEFARRREGCADWARSAAHLHLLFAGALRLGLAANLSRDGGPDAWTALLAREFSPGAVSNLGFSGRVPR